MRACASAATPFVRALHVELQSFHAARVRAEAGSTVSRERTMDDVYTHHQFRSDVTVSRPNINNFHIDVTFATIKPEDFKFPALSGAAGPIAALRAVHAEVAGRAHAVVAAAAPAAAAVAALTPLFRASLPSPDADVPPPLHDSAAEAPLAEEESKLPELSVVEADLLAAAPSAPAVSGSAANSGAALPADAEAMRRVRQFRVDAVKALAECAPLKARYRKKLATGLPLNGGDHRRFAPYVLSAHGFEHTHARRALVTPYLEADTGVSVHLSGDERALRQRLSCRILRGLFYLHAHMVGGPQLAGVPAQ